MCSSCIFFASVFQEDDIILAKCKSFPAWPAVIKSVGVLGVIVDFLGSDAEEFVGVNVAGECIMRIAFVAVCFVFLQPCVYSCSQQHAIKATKSETNPSDSVHVCCWVASVSLTCPLCCHVAFFLVVDDSLFRCSFNT